MDSLGFGPRFYGVRYPAVSSNGNRYIPVPCSSGASGSFQRAQAERWKAQLAEAEKLAVKVAR